MFSTVALCLLAAAHASTGALSSATPAILRKTVIQHEYYPVYAAWGRSKKQFTSGSGERFDNCGVWIGTNATQQRGVFMRADFRNQSFTEVPDAPLQHGGLYLGRIADEDWPKARRAAHAMRLERGRAGYGWLWCKRSAVRLRWAWRADALLQYSTAERIGLAAIAPAAGLVGAGVVTGLACTRGLCRPREGHPATTPVASPAEAVLELTERRRGSWSIPAGAEAGPCPSQASPRLSRLSSEQGSPEKLVTSRAGQESHHEDSPEPGPHRAPSRSSSRGSSSSEAAPGHEERPLLRNGQPGSSGQ